MKAEIISDNFPTKLKSEEDWGLRNGELQIVILSCVVPGENM
jgi:hypothetical protein